MRSSKGIFTLLLAGAAAAVFGCRDAAPQAAIAGPAAHAAAPSFDDGGKTEAGDDGGGNAHAGGARLLGCTAHDSASVSVWVGASGASIRVGNDRLVIPGGALSDSTLITATIPADTLADIHFEPHGLQFAKDVILVLSADGCSLGAETPDHVDYLDNDGNVLETLDGAFNGGSHTVTTRIHHFSSYAIAL